MDYKKMKKVFTTALLALAGAGVGFMAAKLGMDSAKSGDLSSVIAIVLFFLPVFFLVVGFHEAGHAIAGRWVKFDFRMYVVGPLMWDKEESGWKFKWNKNVNLSGGMVICLPTTSENLAKRFSIYALGGPAASLVLTLLAFAIHQLLSFVNTGYSTILNMAGSVFGLMSFLSLMIFVLTIVPLHTGGFYSDGARALRFLRGGDTSRFEILLMKVISSSSGGIRPRQLSAADLHEAVALGNKLDAPMKVYLLYYLYQFALDENDFDCAEKHLVDYLAQADLIPNGIRSMVYLDAVFFFAYVRRNKEQVTMWWSKYEPSAILPKAQVLATEAAMSYLDKDFNTMQTKIELALKEIPNMIDRGVGIALRDRLIEMKSSSLD
jgi:hypothetical protein